MVEPDPSVCSCWGRRGGTGWSAGLVFLSISILFICFVLQFFFTRSEKYLLNESNTLKKPAHGRQKVPLVFTNYTQDLHLWDAEESQLLLSWEPSRSKKSTKCSVLFTIVFKTGGTWGRGNLHPRGGRQCWKRRHRHCWGSRCRHSFCID